MTRLLAFLAADLHVPPPSSRELVAALLTAPLVLAGVGAWMVVVG